jgi:hypothetical protein
MFTLLLKICQVSSFLQNLYAHKLPDKHLHNSVNSVKKKEKVVYILTFKVSKAAACLIYLWVENYSSRQKSTLALE